MQLETLRLFCDVAVLPASLVRDEVAQRILAALPFEHGQHIMPVGAIYRLRRQLPSALIQFLQFLQQSMKGEIS
jgi:DNA-binding transcriptional LysR family regulator